MSSMKKYEVQRTNNFRVVINMGDHGESEAIELALDSISLPTVSTNPIELSYGNSNVKVAGNATFDDVSVTVKDFIEVDVENILWKWRKSVYDPETDKVGWVSQYKKDGTIYQYGPDGTAIRSWVIVGCWPTNLDLGELSYDASDKKSISMALSIDRAYPRGESTNKMRK